MTSIQVQVVMVLLFATVITAQNRGIIYIGYSNTDLLTDLSYRSSQIGIDQPIPIYAAVFSNAALTQTVPKTDDINVYCIVISSGQGFTEVDFLSNLTLSGTADRENITHRPRTVGRPVSIQCTAESTSHTCPIGSGGAEFCPVTALSNIVKIQVLPPPTVTQCQLEVSVIASGTFQITLSEEAEEAVTVTCTSGTGSSLILSIASLTLPARSSEGQMSYQITSGAVGSTARVTCSANSASQFGTTSSTVAASTALFTRVANSLSFEPEYLQVYNTTVTSFLVLENSLGNQRVSVACSAQTANSLEDAEGVLPTCANIQTAGSTSGPWRVGNINFELIPNTPGQTKYYHAVTTERLEIVTQASTEIIVTTCCVTSPADLAVLTVARSITVATLAPFICEFCNTTVSDPTSERVLQNPGYVEVAPCACDLTENACDFNCCCDGDCSANQVARFSSCVQGLPGGQPAESEEYKCSSNAFNLPDWHLLTCVYWEENAYLGMYYMNRARITEESFRATVAKEYKGRFSLSQTETTNIVTRYSYGISVNTIREDLSGSTSVSYKGIMALPQPSPAGGSCSPHQPVKFLVNQKSSCTSQVTADSCSSLSTFSGRIYAVSSAISGCSQSFKVTTTYGGSTIVPTDVKYLCATDVTPYQPDTVTSLDDLPQTQRSTFGSQLAGENCTIPCANDVCLGYNAGRSAEATKVVPGICSWDDGSTAPRVPEVSGSTNCDNVVLSVKYVFEWSSSNIVSLNADIVLGTVSIGSSITQDFEVEWQYKTNGSRYSLSDNFSGTSDAYERSGSSGYEFGAPLFSGCPLYDSTGQNFLGVATNDERKMSVWQPGADGLCENAKRQSINFGEDVLSACALRLTVNDLETGCDDLKESVTNHLNVVMPSDLLGRYGYNNLQELTMWIPVTRQNLNSTEDGFSPLAINDSSTFRSWADAITGQCRLPTAVQLNVMYTQTGEVDGNPRLEVVGAYISYEESTWAMDCQGANAGRCQASSGLTQNFILTSSVHFIQVDTTSQTSETRFHTRCDPYDFSNSPSCERYFSHVYRDACYYETCWQELAYPILPAAEKGPRYDWRLKALPAFLTLVLGIVGYASVAKPGWS